MQPHHVEMSSLVVIVEGNELAKLPVTSQGSCLIGDSLHVAAVSQDDIPADAAPPPLHTGLVSSRMM